MRHKTAFPVSATVVEAARNLAQHQKRLLLKQSSSEASDTPASSIPTLRKVPGSPGQALDAGFEADNSMLVLNPSDVDYYDGNPRFDLGEDYPTLKESIRTQGLNTKLSVTRRPGAKRYMVEAGGNRRLRAIKELIEEGEERFRSELFVFRAWKGESTVLLRHLSENMQRAGMTLFEEASGVLRLKRVLEEERGESYSLRRLEEILGDIGFPVTKSALSIYAFAVERLAVLGPATKALTVKATRDVLQSGFNRLARLAALFEVDEQLLYEHCLNPVMEATGRRYAESSAFNTEGLYAECEEAVATRLQVSPSTLRQRLAVLKVRPNASREELMAPVPTVAPAESPADCPIAAVAPLQAAPNCTADPETSGAEASVTAPVLTLPTASSSGSSGLDVALQRFAAAVGAEAYVRRHAALPLGYYIDVPDRTSAPNQELSAAQSPDAPEDATFLPLDLQRAHGCGSPYLYQGWWLLLQVSGLLGEGGEPDIRDDLLRRLPDDCAWRRAADLGYEEMERIFTDVTGPKPDFAYIVDWLTSPDHPLTAHLWALLAAIREHRGSSDARCQ